MANFKINNDLGILTIQHRAVCKNCKYKSPEWHANITDAYKDANDHQMTPGFNTHQVKIVSQQTVETTFVKNIMFNI